MFEKILVKNPKRARFDFSHGNTLSMQFGKLTPTEIRFIVPGDDVTVSMEQIVRVAPMPVPTFVNMKVRHDWFFVPLSMIYNQQALDALLGQNPTGYFRVSTNNLGAYVNYATNYSVSPNGLREPFLPGTIHDYFNLPVFSDINMTDVGTGNALSAWSTFVTTPNSANYVALITDNTVTGKLASLPGVVLEPMFAYHYIWRDWFRFTGMDVFNSSNDFWLENHVVNTFMVANKITSGTLSSYGVSVQQYHGGSGNLYDFIGVPYNAMIKKDMFSSARYGTKPQVLIPTGSSGTIPNLRTASALQKFIDIITVSGQRYWDKVKALWNETPDGMKCERAQFLARYMSYIKVGEVITTASTAQANTGDYAGRGMLVDGKYLFKRHFSEHGWLMCISSIVPEMAYNGYDRQLWDANILDTPIPSFANVGDQSIINREIRVMYNNALYDNNASFGDQFRYYAYKSDVNRIHGDFLMSSFSPWTAILPYDSYLTMDAKQFSEVRPIVWNKIFDATAANQPFFNGRFFVDLTFHEFITRNLPKYVSYAL